MESIAAVLMASYLKMLIHCLLGVYSLQKMNFTTLFPIFH